MRCFSGILEYSRWFFWVWGRLGSLFGEGDPHGVALGDPEALQGLTRLHLGVELHGGDVVVLAPAQLLEPQEPGTGEQDQGQPKNPGMVPQTCGNGTPKNLRMVLKKSGNGTPKHLGMIP